MFQVERQKMGGRERPSCVGMRQDGIPKPSKASYQRFCSLVGESSTSTAYLLSS